MNIELLLLIEKHTDTLIEHTKSRTKETLEFNMNKQMQIFSFNPPINLLEEGKYLLAVTSFEATNSPFNIIDENNSFSISIPGHCNSESAEKATDNLNKFLEFRSENDIELHDEEVEKNGT